MKKSIFFIIACTAFSCMRTVYGQDIFAGYEHLFKAPRQYTAYQTTEAIRIDGKLNEPAWGTAPWSAFFTDIEGDKKPVPALQTRFKLIWDSQYVYVAAELEEPDIWANIKEHDAIVFWDNDFEIFIDPDGDAHNYFEIEVNAVNTIFDLFLPRPYRNGGLALTTWDVQHLRSAVSVSGTVNQAKDIDKKWYVEMAIPFRSLNLGNRLSKAYTDWRINFSRVEWDTEIINGRYVKRTDSVTRRPKAEHNWVWSPQGVVNMHFPERWGHLHFSTEKAGVSEKDQPLTSAEQIQRYLWLFYYKQQEYKRQYKQFATALSEINFPASIEVAGINCSISLEATGTQFKASAVSIADGEKWQIDHEGKINKTAIHDQ